MNATTVEIINKYHLSGRSPITTAIISTMKGKIWLHNSDPAGRDAYLPDIDLILFKNEVDTRRLDRNCLNTKEAFLIIHDF